jgi:glutamine amidotransferase
MQELSKSHATMPSLHELSITLQELLPQVTRYGTFNCLLSNGQALWAHASTSLYFVLRQHPFTYATLTDQDLSVDFAKFTSPEDRAVVVVTSPLTTNEDWTAFKTGELRLFVDGRHQTI